MTIANISEMLSVTAEHSDVTVVVTKRNMATQDLRLRYNVSSSLQFLLHRSQLCTGPRRSRALESIFHKDNEDSDGDVFRSRVDVDLSEEEFDIFPALVHFIYYGEINVADAKLDAFNKLAVRFQVDSTCVASSINKADTLIDIERKRKRASEPTVATCTDLTDQSNNKKSLLDGIDGKEIDSNHTTQNLSLLDLPCLMSELQESGSEKLQHRIIGLIDESAPENIISAPGIPLLLLQTMENDVFRPLLPSAMRFFERVARQSKAGAEKIGQPQIVNHLCRFMLTGNPSMILPIFLALIQQTKNLTSQVISNPNFMDSLRMILDSDCGALVMSIAASVADHCPETLVSADFLVREAANLSLSHMQQSGEAREKVLRCYFLGDDNHCAKHNPSQARTLVSKLVSASHMDDLSSYIPPWELSASAIAFRILTDVLGVAELTNSTLQCIHINMDCFQKRLQFRCDDLRQALCLFIEKYFNACRALDNTTLSVTEGVAAQFVRIMTFDVVRIRIAATRAVTSMLINYRPGVVATFAKQGVVLALFKALDLDDGTKEGQAVKMRIPLAIQSISVDLTIPIEVHHTIATRLSQRLSQLTRA